MRRVISNYWYFSIICLLFTHCQSSSSNTVNTDPTPPKVEAINAPSIVVDTTQYPTLMNLDYILGRYKPAEHPDLERIPDQYTDKSGIYLHSEALSSYVKMYDAAKAAGHDLVIRSATRNFNYQKSIWEAKWNGSRILSSGINAAKDISDPIQRAKEIMKYSAMPGASRHHWATDIDLNAFDNSYFASGKGKSIYEWLVANAATYGYYQVYTAKGDDRTTGYEEEKWHWTYKPISKHLTAYAKVNLTDEVFSDFSGSDHAPALHVVSDYVLGIHPKCH